jgi:ribosome biogenesis GTPase
LLGSSGVGKTTLLNNLAGGAMFKTRAVRGKDSKGRHATTHRQLIKLECEAMLIDTPGMRELGNFSVEKGIDETFAEIAELAERCQFCDCTHVHEKGCAVLEAVDNGQVPVDRYHNYIKMKKESAYHEMTYLEKRKKDRQFGKLCKTVMAHKKRRTCS